MDKTSVSAKKWAIVLFVCFITSSLSGCIESSFDLANGSRLPGWFTPPPGLTRADVSVTLDYKLSADTFTFRDSNGKKLAVVNGRTEFWLSGTHFQVLTVKGITEVVRLRPYQENQNMVQNGHIVALFYVIDDPAIKQEVLAAAGIPYR